MVYQACSFAQDRLRVLTSLITLWVVLSSAASDKSEPAAGLAAKTRPAVVTLFSVDPRFRWPSYQGSGFLISEDGILVTARHVAESETDLFAVTADGKRHSVTGFLGENVEYDIAVLKLDGNGWPCIPLASAALPQINQLVAVISPDPNGGTLCATGAVRAVPALQNLWEAILTTIQIHHGQSGSPLLNETGAVLGVVSGVDDAERGSAMPVKIVHTILTNSSSSGPIPFSKRPRTAGGAPLILDSDFRAALESIAHEDWRSGQRKLKKAIARFPDSPIVLLMLGASYVKAQSWKQADAIIGKVVELKPDSGLAWYFLGTTAAARGRYGQSDVAFKKSMELGFGDKDQLVAAWKLMAITSAHRKNVPGVVEALDNLKGLDPNQAVDCLRQIRHDFPKLALPSERGDE